ncbi:hypothetical protein DFH28DRAFT_870305, partial [Melampsora americana]
LAVSGTTCTVERVFSNATDFCSQDCAGLAPPTITRSVCSHEWTKNGSDPGGEYDEA